MAGRCLPRHPRFQSDAERTVWEAFRRRLRDCDVLLHGVRFTGDDGDWEADLVVLMPEGFATVEVKGGQVRYVDGEYRQLTREGERTINLDEQALSEKYVLRRYLVGHDSWSLHPPRMVHAVALPDTALASDADLGPGLPRHLVLARGEEADGLGRIYDLLGRDLENQPKTPPGPDGVDLAAELLGGRGDPQLAIAHQKAVRDDEVQRLTQAQFRVLDMARSLPRVQVVGGPGTGKTFLAIEQARRWAGSGMRVALVAYSRGLTTWIGRVIDSWPDTTRANVDVVTFHSLGHRWGVQVQNPDDQSEWEDRLPRMMAQRAAALPDGDRYDALIVDEAQDFGALWWPPLMAALREPASARFMVFSDAAQRVFEREGSNGLDLPVLTLDENLRNSGPIANAVNGLLPSQLHVLGGHGPAVRLVPCTEEEAVDTADDQADRLLDEGWAHSDIALLTTNHRHPVQQELVEAHGRDGYWSAFWDGEQFFYGTVAGFKGLERSVVVLAVDGFRDPAVAREVLLVGMSRARDLLVVCGDPEALRTVGGKEFAKRLRGRTH